MATVASEICTVCGKPIVGSEPAHIAANGFVCTECHSRGRTEPLSIEAQRIKWRTSHSMNTGESIVSAILIVGIIFGGAGSLMESNSGGLAAVGFLMIVVLLISINAHVRHLTKRP